MFLQWVGFEKAFADLHLPEWVSTTPSSSSLGQWNVLFDFELTIGRLHIQLRKGWGLQRGFLQFGASFDVGHCILIGIKEADWRDRYFTRRMINLHRRELRGRSCL